MKINDVTVEITQPSSNSGGQGHNDQNGPNGQNGPNDPNGQSGPNGKNCSNNSNQTSYNGNKYYLIGLLNFILLIHNFKSNYY